MKNEFKILIFIFIVFSGNLYSQSLDNDDKELIEVTLNKILNDIRNRNFIDLKQNSTKNIYCLLCFNSVNDYNRPEISRQNFIKIISIIC